MIFSFLKCRQRLKGRDPTGSRPESRLHSGVLRRGESGNVFFTLFGAVALVGVVGVATSTLMRGPVGTVVKLNQTAKADAQMQIAHKLAMLEAAQQSNSGDCDTDGFVEPIGPDTTSPSCVFKPQGGGCIPSQIGSSKNDPWGTNYGYCAWDHGGIIGNNCSPNGANVLDGAPTSDKIVIAIISAGPDRQFQTRCLPDNGVTANPEYVVKGSGSDDLVLDITYAGAVEASGGLWKLKSGEPGMAEIDKGIEVAGEARFNSGGQFSGGMLEFTGADTYLKLPDETSSGSCNAANEGVLRRNTATGQVVEICDPGTGWAEVGGSGSTAGAQGNAGDIQFSSTKAGAFDAAPGQLTYSAGTLNAPNVHTTANADIDGTLNVDGNSTLGDVSADNADISDADITTLDASTANVGSLTASGAANLNGGTTTTSLTASGTAALNGGATTTTLTASGAAALNGGATTTTLTASGAAALNGGTTTTTLTASGNATFQANASVTGDVFGRSYQSLGNPALPEGLFFTSGNTLEMRTEGMPRLFIESDGDVGIGITNPEATLDVAGAIKVGLEGNSCDASLYGAIRYSSAEDELQICSMTDAWETVGTSGGGGGNVGGVWDDYPAYIAFENSSFIVKEAQGTLPFSSTGTKMMWFPAKKAFRVGSASGSQWDDGKMGESSVAMGLDSEASGETSFAVGDRAAATTEDAVAIGSQVQARATGSIALGNQATVAAGALNSMALGLGVPGGATPPQVQSQNSLGIFMGNQNGVNLNRSGVMGIFGGKLLLDPGAPSTQNDVSGSLAMDVQGDVGAVQFCDEDGGNCFTAEEIATGSVGVPGADSEVLFNSGGSLGSDPGLVYLRSTKSLGIGTDTPVHNLDIYNADYSGLGLSTGSGAADSMAYVAFFTQRTDLTKWLGEDSTNKGWTQTIYDHANGAAADRDDLRLTFWNGATYKQAISFESSGRIGLGSISTPQAQLHMTEQLLLGTINDCTAATKGALRMNAVFDTLQMCDGAGTYINIGGAKVAAPGSDRQIVFNSGNELAAAPGFVFTSAGRMGIGTANPTDPLHVIGGTKIEGGSVSVIGSNTPGITLSTNNNAGGNSYINLMGGASGPGMLVGGHFFMNYNGSWASASVASIEVNRESAFDDVSMRFSTKAAGVAMAERMRISPTGRVGIGTTSPQTRLDVAGTIKMAYGGETCDASREGAIQYTSANDSFYVCPTGGGGWKKIIVQGGAGGSPAAGSDRQIQYNSGNELAANTRFVFSSAGDLIVGSYQTKDTGTGSEDKRMYFDVSKGSFRAGGATGSQWNAANVGDYSFAMGLDTTASGLWGTFAGGARITCGDGIFSTGQASLAFGYVNAPVGGCVNGGRIESTGQGTIAMGFARGNNGIIRSSGVSGGIAMGFAADNRTLQASGAYGSIAMGAAVNGTLSATGQAAVAIGEDVQATANNAFSLGQNFTNGTAQSFAVGFGQTDLFVNNHRIGMGTTSPQTRLDVAGTAKIAYGGETCDASREGAIQYTSANDSFYVCPTGGGGWKKIIVQGGAGGLPAAGSDTQIQFNSGNELWASGKLRFDSTGDLIVSTTAKPGWMSGGVEANKANIYAEGSIQSDQAVIAGEGKHFSWFDSSTKIEGSGMQDYIALYTDSAEKIRLTSIGRLGVGTSAPDQQVVFNLPAVSTSSYLKIFSSTNNFSTYMGAPGSNQYAWTTNVRFDGTSWIKDVPAKAGWRINEAVNTTDAASSINFDLFAVGSTTSNTLMRISGTGGISMGHINPQTRLDVAGTAKIAYGGETCDASREGAIQYTSANDSFYVCPTGGGGWKKIIVQGGAGGLPAAGSDTQLQFNSGNELWASSGLRFDSSGDLIIGTALKPAWLTDADSDLAVEGSIAGDYVNVTNESGYSWGDSSTKIWGSANWPDDYIAFYTDSAEHLRLTSTGRLGIGTSTPATSLHVVSGLSIGTDGTTGSQQAELNLITKGGNALGVGDTAAKGWHITARGDGYPFAFEQNDLAIYYFSAGSSSIALGIDSATKNIGIGTGTPQTRLDVAGTIKMAFGGEVCDASREGAIQYTSANDSFYVCPTGGGGWKRIITQGGTGGSPAGGNDRQIQFNSGNELAGDYAFVFTSTGNMGLGTITPKGSIHIARPHAVLAIESDETNDSDITLLTAGDGQSGLSEPNAKGWGIIARGASYPFAEEQNSLVYSYWNGTGWNSAVTMTSTGRLGAGTTTPHARITALGIGVGNYQALELTNKVADGDDKGAMIVGARKNNANTPFTAFGTWDDGIDRKAYIGGGGWETPDANVIGFYTAPTYTETVETAIQRMRIAPNGFVSIGDHGPAYKFDVRDTVTFTSGWSTMSYNAQTVNPSGNSTGNYRGLMGYSALQGANNVTGSVVGVQAEGYHSGTGTLSYLNGVRSYVSNEAAGTVTEATGGNFSVANTDNGGTITKSRGVSGYVENHSATTAMAEAVGGNFNVSNTGMGGIVDSSGVWGGTYNLAPYTMGSATGIWGYVMNDDTGTITNSYGAVGEVRNRSSGTLTNAYATYSEVRNQSTGSVNSSVGLYSRLRNDGGGTVTDWYGLYIGSVMGAAPTNYNYGIYVEDVLAKNYFAGKLRIGNGSTNPQAHLDVGGTIKIASGGEACDVNREGAIRFLSATNSFEVCADNADGWEPMGTGAGGGTIYFTSLADVPVSYSSAAKKFVRVNASETGLEFTDRIVDVVTGEPEPGGINLDDLGDVDVGGVGSGQCLKYNNGSGEWEPGDCLAPGEGSQWSNGAGDTIYYNSGTPRVAIGTNTANDTLDVVGTMQVTGGVDFGSGLHVAGPVDFDTTLNLDGAATFQTTLNMTGGLINNVANPVGAQDAATKAYVDSLFMSSTGQTAPGGSRQIIFNSGNLLATDANFVFGSSGNLGVGTANPYSFSKLTVHDSGARPVWIQSSNTDFFMLTLRNTNITAANGGQWGIGINGSTPTTLSAYPSGALLFHQDVWGPRMMITKDGNVGIGVSSASAKLSVAGAVKIAYNNETCNAAMVGAIRYSSTNDKTQYCANNGGSPVWTNMNAGAAGIPAGGVVAFNLAACPTGWTEVTDLRGRVVIGVGTLGAQTYALGATGGEAFHTLTTAEMPSHNHSVDPPATASGNNSVGHTHGVGTYATASAGAHTHSVDPPSTATSADGGHAHDLATGQNLGPGGGNRIVRADGTAQQTLATSAVGDHSHTVDIGSFTSGSSGAHTHTISGSSGAESATHTHTTDIAAFNTGNQGSGTAHENRMPYKAYIYCESTGASGGGGSAGSTDGIWQVNASNHDTIYYASGTTRVAIGTTNADDALDVVGTMQVTGAVRFDTTLDMTNGLINNVANPIGAQDAATKAYVDSLFMSSTGQTAPGGSRQIIFNSGNLLAANTNFVFTSAGMLGLGTASPAADAHIYKTSGSATLRLETSAGTIPAILHMRSGGLDYTMNVQGSTNVRFGPLGGDSTDVLFETSSTNGLNQLMLLTSGRVGVGTAAPQTRLDIAGTAKIAYGGEACDASREGAIQYTSANDSFYVCPTGGGGWKKIITQGGTGGSPAAGANTQIQFNSGNELAANANFVFTSAGRMGLGTANPGSVLEIVDASDNNRHVQFEGRNDGLGFQLRAPGDNLFLSVDDVRTGSAALVVSGDGNGVGVWTNYPQARLDVAGTAKIAYGGEACDASREGAIQYTSASDSFYVCPTGGGGWKRIITQGGTGGSPAGGSDRQLQFNSGNELAGAAGFVYTSTGNLGIGTNAPAGALQVARDYIASDWKSGVIAYSSVSGSSAVYNGFGAFEADVTNKVTGTGYSEAYGYVATIRTANDGDDQRGLGFYAAGETHASDKVRLFEAIDADSSTGGTQYGLYIQLTDPDVMRYGIYQETDNINFLSGSLGMGANSVAPKTKLDVSGTIKIASGGEACDTDREGAIRFVSNGFEVCADDADGWEPMGTGASGGTIYFTSLADVPVSYTSAAHKLVRVNAAETGLEFTDEIVDIVTGASQPTGINLDDLGDVNISSPADGDCLVYNNAGGYWEESNECGDISAPGSDRQLVFNSGNQLAANANFVFTSAGRLGIGTNSPANVLQVAGPGDNNIIVGPSTSTNASAGIMLVSKMGGTENWNAQIATLWNGTLFYRPAPSAGNSHIFRNTAGADVVTIDAIGKVGIGASTPQSRLDIAGTAKIAYGGEACDASREGAIQYTSANDSFYVCPTGGGGWKKIIVQGGSGSAPAAGSNSQIQFNSGNELAANANFVFTSAGSLGVGTANPGAYKLNVAGDVNIDDELMVGDYIGLWNSGGVGWVDIAGIGDANYYAGLGLGEQGSSKMWDIAFKKSTDDLRFIYSPDGSTYVTPLTLQATGNVGMGTNAPTTRLDVSGTTKIAYGGEACDTSREGAIRFVSATNSFEVCADDANGWEAMGGDAADNLGNHIATQNIQLGDFWLSPGSDDEGIRFVSNGSDTTVLVSAEGGMWMQSGNFVVMGPEGTDSGTEIFPTAIKINSTDPGEAPRFILSDEGQAIGPYLQFEPTGAGSTHWDVGSRGADWPVVNEQSDFYIGYTTDNWSTTGFVGMMIDSETGGVILGSSGYVNGDDMPSLTVYGDTLFHNPGNSSDTDFEIWTGGDDMVELAAGPDDGIKFYVDGEDEDSTLYLASSGRVSIGRLSDGSKPQAVLDVLGTLKIADGGEACDANREGAIRFISNGFEVCADDATGWEPMGVGAAGSIAFVSLSDTPSGYSGEGGKYLRVTAAEDGVEFTDEIIEQVAGGVPTGMILNDLSDVNATPANGEVLMYSAGSGTWVAGTAGGVPAGNDRTIQFKSGSAFAGNANLVFSSAGRIGLGTASPQTSLHIAETSPRIALFDNDNALSAANPAWVMRAQDSGGPAGFKIQSTTDYTTYTNRFVVDASGRVGIGTSSPAVKFDVLQTDPSLTSMAARTLFVPAFTGTWSGGNLHAAWSEITLSDNNGVSNALYGAVNRVASVSATTGSLSGGVTGSINDIVNNGNKNITSAIGSISAVNNGGTGTITAAVGSSGTMNNLSTGTITNAQGLYAKLINNGGGTVANWYGLYVDTVTGTAPTTSHYGVYVADSVAKNYFAGTVGVGVPAPATKLDVAGTLKIANGAEACDATREGAIKYDGATDKFSICAAAGTGWEIIGSSGVGGLWSDSGAGYIQYNTTLGGIRVAGGTGYAAPVGGSTGSDTLAGLSCSSGQIAKWNGSAWACAADGGGSGGGGGSTSVAFSVNKNGASQSVPAATLTKITWPNEDFDINNNFASDTFTPTVAGKYILTTTVGSDSLGNGVLNYVYITKNGTTIARNGDSNGTTTGDANPSVSVIADANGTTDYFEVFVWHSSGTYSISGINGETNFTGALIGGGGGGESLWVAGTGDAIYYNSGTDPNVGIGTADPEALLHLYDADNTAELYLDGLKGGVIRFLSSGNEVATLRSDAANGSNIGELVFEVTNGAGDDTVEAVRILRGGNFGIGTTNPTERLHVAGDIRASSSLILGMIGGIAPPLSGGAADLADLGDVDVTGVSNGEVLMYSGGTWVPGTASGGGASSINDLSDAITAYGNDGTIFLGSGAGNASSTGIRNTYVGTAAGAANTSGQRNTFMGVRAGLSNLGGSTNVFIGAESGSGNTGGNSNIYIGDKSGQSNVNGSSNVFVGNSAGRSYTDGSGNTGVGTSALFGSSSTGSNNTAFGMQAGDSITTGSNNLLIGYDVDVLSPTQNNFLNIGNTIYGDISTHKVGVGVNAPTEALDVVGNIKLSSSLMLNPVNGLGAPEYAVGADNLGDHTATEDLDLATNDILNAGAIGGASATLTGGVKIGSVTTCNAGAVGTIRYSGDVVEYCKNNGGSPAWTSMGSGGSGGTPTVQVFTSGTNATWTKPTGVQYIKVTVIGGGGGGGGADSTAAADYTSGGGGGGGGVAIKWIDVSSVSTKKYTVGTAGSGGSNTGGNGTAGGQSCFGDNATACTTPDLSANGGSLGNGSGGGTADLMGTGGAGGTATGGNYNFTGTGGDKGYTLDAQSRSYGGAGGDSAYGSGGASPAINSATAVAGNNGANYGGGGSGAVSAATAGAAGGAGSSGTIIVEEFYGGGGGGGGGSDNLGNHTATQDLDLATNDILNGGTATFSGAIAGGSATITGDLTVDTSTLKVSASTNRVGVANASPTEALDVTGNVKVSDGILMGLTGGLAAPVYLGGGGGGTGDVAGPASSTDNAVARFDGTTGKLIQNSAVTIADDGATVITSNNADALVIGPNGATNPVLRVKASVASQATGIEIRGEAATNDVVIQALSSNTSEGIRIEGKNNSHVTLATSGNARLKVTDATVEFTANTAWNSAASARFSYLGGADTNLTASTEAKSVYFNLGQTRQHATGALTLQRDFRIAPTTHSFVGASTLTNAATFAVDGAPLGGANATITNSSAIYVPTSALTGVTNGYGLNITAPTGATNNYAATFSGKVGIGTAAPSSALEIVGDIELSSSLIFTPMSGIGAPVYLGGGGGGATPAGSNGQIQFNSGGTALGASGNLTFNGAKLAVTGDIEYTGTITDISDMRLKTDIKPLDTQDVIGKLSQVNTYSFRMKNDAAGRVEFGVMAQELEKIFPELVQTAADEMGTKSVNYIGLIAPLIEASKELKADNDNLRAELASMKAERAEMHAALDELRTDVKGLKAHTGYGISKAEIGLWMLAGMGGTALLFFFGTAILRRRRGGAG